VSPRSRETIVANLEAIYREAYDRARTADDKARMQELDSAFQREQLILEVLMDIRDALGAQPATKGSSTLETLHALRRFAKP
jgi:hypothetical protein